MTRNRSTWMVTAALVLVGAGLSAQTTPAQLSENRIQELIRQAAERVANGQTTVQPGGGTGQTTQTTPAAGDTRPVVRLTLDDAVKAALDHNLDIAVQRLNPAINDIAIASLRAVYHPSLTSQIATQSLTTPSTSSISGGSTTTNRRQPRPRISSTRPTTRTGPRSTRSR
jgi:hypothetical protein